jgi:hypothetical protein
MRWFAGAAGVLLSAASLPAAEAASTADAWIEALSSVTIRCDAQIAHPGITREQGVRNVLAAVRAQRPALSSLEVVASPAAIGAATSRIDRAPDLDLAASDVLAGFCGRRVRIEIDGRVLRLVEVDPEAEGLRRALAAHEKQGRLLAALASGRADSDVVEVSMRLLRRPTEVASEGIGIAGMTPASLFAFAVIASAPDAAERFLNVERTANTAGKLYARAGLLASGWTAAQIDRLPPLDGKVHTMSGCLGTEVSAAAFFRDSVRTGDFARGIREHVQGTLARAVALSPRMEAALAGERARLSGRAAETRGRVLADEIPVVTLVDLMNTGR